MKLRFKTQDFQTRAVEAVVNCFKGQPEAEMLKYRMDLGKTDMRLELTGFKNQDIKPSKEEILWNIKKIQHSQNLAVDKSLVESDISPFNLDVEMETGTGKTYCYIKTIFEMNKRYGWSKFIVVVPSIAIREGVYKSLQITAEHFLESYGKKAKCFIYNSRQLHELENFSSDSGINIMVINIQAFNSRGRDNRRIYEELDDFQSRKPIDVIKANKPILILDEPQKMEGKTTIKSLKNFDPLMILRYSATHKTHHNKVHRLDAFDAYKQKLVKKISVRGIKVTELSGTNAYLYLQSIEISTSAPVARMEIEIKQQSGIKKVIRKIKKGDNLYDISKLDQYKDFVVSEIDARINKVSFTNGIEIEIGEVWGDINELSLRRIQMREAIQAHFDKEEQLFRKRIKVLTLFFIDQVSNYRKYSDTGEKQNGEYAKIFEEEYSTHLKEVKKKAGISYKKYLEKIETSKTHNGYFSIDKKTKKLVDPDIRRANNESDDTNAYDLILKDKERLLSFEEPTRFIFSHSALREGWDNPNVFVICPLKHSSGDNAVPRRQEIGRGLRIAVNQQGERQDDKHTVHETNILTVVASESYEDFASALQKEIKEAFSGRPRKANEKYFSGKLIKTTEGGEEIEITDQMATEIHKRYLKENDYIDNEDYITDKYFEDLENDNLAEVPKSLKKYEKPILELVAAVVSDKNIPSAENDRNKKENKLNDNFKKKAFKELWKRINKKTIYGVKFDSSELIEKVLNSLEEKEFTVPTLQYVITTGEQRGDLEYEEVLEGQILDKTQMRYETEPQTIHSEVKYDLIGKITEATGLKRKTVANILTKIKEETFAQFKKNPEVFISKFSALINEQKATMIIERLTYNTIAETYTTDIFTDAQSHQFFSKTEEKLKKHIYDYVATDSNVEREFVETLEISPQIEVYAKLPRGFYIPTPVGNYNPDWAICFYKNSIKHIYFVAETKGSMSSMKLRGMEKEKIKCARKFFEALNEEIDPNKVKYDIVKNFEELMELVAQQ